MEHLSTFSEADMDKVDASFERIQYSYECKHCKHHWNEIKNTKTRKA